MKQSSVAAAMLGAAALGLLARGAAAQPLVPFQPPHRHSMVAGPVPAETLATPVRRARSLVSAPRPGTAVPGGPLVPRAAGYAQAFATAAGGVNPAMDPWTAVGPAPLHNAGGAFGGLYDPRPDMQFDAGLYQDISGRMVAIAPDPSDPKTFYIGAAGGGIWKTTDAGKSYRALTDFTGDTAMGSITVAPSNPQVIYAGSGEANFAGDSRWGNGVLKSTDGGATWSVIPGPITANSPRGVFFRKAISRIQVDSTDANTVYLGTVLAGLNGNGFSDGGVWKTTDGGYTWTNTTAGKPGLTSLALYTDVAMNAQQPSVLYTAVGYPGQFSRNGVFKTVDGGDTWTRLTGGLPQPFIGKLAKGQVTVGGQTTIALFPSADGTADTVYVSIPDTNQNLLGLYKSVDGGASFAKLPAPDYLTGQAFYDNAVVVSPTDPNVFFAAGKVNYADVFGFVNTPTDYNNLRTLVGTTDGGKTFHDFSLGKGFVGPHTDTHALSFTLDGKLLDGNDGGIWRLENPTVANPTPPANDMDASNSNIQWTDINNNLNTLQFTGIALDPSNATVAYGGAQDNGTSKQTGINNWTQVRGGDGGFTRVDNSHPQTVYHEYYGISLERSDDGGQTWNGATNGINPNDPAGNFNMVGAFGQNTDPAAFYVPYKLDPLNQSHVVYGTDHLYLSTDKGDNFVAIGTPGVAGFNPNDATIDTLAIAGGTIYVEAGGSIFVTTDNGATWTDRSIPNVTDPLGDLFVDPANPQDVLAAKDTFDDASVGKIFRSTNGGAAWRNITANLPDLPFNAIKRDLKSGVLYAGGDDGVYSTVNFGGSWKRIVGSLPTVQVVDLDVINPTGLLGAGTHGRGLYTMPLSKTVAAANVIGMAKLTRTSAGTVQVVLTLSNFGISAGPAGSGAADALNAVLNSITLNGKTGTPPTPVAVGAIAPYSQVPSLTFTFTGVGAGPGTLKFAGTFTGGTFGGSQRVSVP
jgi:photosystem II stability/assembly factor-like uncharacterized protein